MKDIKDITEILIVAATGFEISLFLDHLMKNSKSGDSGKFQLENHNIHFIVTGVGSMATAFHIAQYSNQNKIDFAVNAGIAGAFHRSLQLGEVVHVVEDRFGDLGVEEADGSLTDLFELKLLEKDTFPYLNGILKNSDPLKLFPKIRQVRGLTVNKVHGNSESIRTILKKYNAQIETMEGIGFFYACKVLGIPCIQLRSISNFVEERDRTKWEIDKAITALNNVLIEFALLL